MVVRRGGAAEGAQRAGGLCSRAYVAVQGRGGGGRGGLGWWSDGGGDGQAEKRRLSYISLRLCPWNIAINIQFVAQAHALAQALAQA